MCRPATHRGDVAGGLPQGDTGGSELKRPDLNKKARKCDAGLPGSKLRSGLCQGTAADEGPSPLACQRPAIKLNASVFGVYG